MYYRGELLGAGTEERMPGQGCGATPFSGRADSADPRRSEWADGTDLSHLTGTCELAGVRDARDTALNTGSLAAAAHRLTFRFPAHGLLQTRAARRGRVLPGAFPRGTLRAGCRGRGGRGARSGARGNLRTWHLPHGETRAGGRRAAAAAPSPLSGPRLSTLPRAGSAAERVGGQAREGKGEEGGREGEGEARPRGGGALSRGLPGSLAAAVVMSAMLAMAQGADRAGERRI